MIESARANSPGNADYARADDMMSRGVTKGVALAAPTLARRVAARAAERSSILKERRKYAEEMHLPRVPKKLKGGGKGDGGADPGAWGAR